MNPSPRISALGWLSVVGLLFWSVLIAAIFYGCQPAEAGEVKFAWNANPEPDIATYRLSYGTETGSLDHSVNTGNVTQYTLDGLADGQTYHFVLQAVNEAGIESDPTDPIVHTVGVGSLAPPLDMTGTVLHAFSSEEVDGEDGRAVNAIDGNLATFWHSKWSGGSPAMPPHYLAIRLPRDAMASVLYYWPRQDGETNGDILTYEVETSMDGETWTQVAAGEWAPGMGPKHAPLSYGEARYARIWTNDQFATAANLAIGGTWVPEPPASIQLTIQDSGDLQNWTTRSTMTLPKHDRHFFRLGVSAGPSEIQTYYELVPVAPP